MSASGDVVAVGPFGSHRAFATALGADEATVEALLGASNLPALAPARVVHAERGVVMVRAPEGTRTFRTRAALAAGDWVVVDEANAVVATLERRTVLSRHAPGLRTQAQVLAVNLDVVLICAALTQPAQLEQVERALVLSWESGARPLIVLTKADIVTRDEAQARHAQIQAIAPGIDVVITSVVTGQGVATILASGGPGRTLAVLGPSGVGKSRLINALAGSEAARVGAVRVADGAGRQTTVRRELIPLPTGGVVLDTPGLRDFALWTSDEGLERTYSDIEVLAKDCRFRDCAHYREPGCAVLAAVADGRLDSERVARRAVLREEQDRLETRQVDAARLAARGRSPVRPSGPRRRADKPE